MKLCLVPVAALTMLSACAYSPPEESGLIAVRPYPTDADVCQEVGESAATAQFLDHTQLLIACPTHERGAIADRQSEGGVIVGTAGKWRLLHIPQG